MRFPIFPTILLIILVTGKQMTSRAQQPVARPERPTEAWKLVGKFNRL